VSGRVRLSPLTSRDIPNLLGLIRALAKFEHLPPPDKGAGRRLRAALRAKGFHGLIARQGGHPVGYALYFFTYSSFLARPTFYLEDLFVLPGARRSGIGGKLFRACAGIARKRRCGRMEWAVLDWNRPAHRFYRKEGGRILSEWQPYRMTLRKGAF